MHPPITQTAATEKASRRKGSFKRIIRGYLMLVGAGTTIYALILLLVQLLVKLQLWMV